MAKEVHMDFTLPKLAHTIITDGSDLPKFYEEIGNWPMLSFDFETTGLDYYNDNPVGVAIANGRHAWYIHGSAFMEVTPWLKDKMGRTDIEWAGHNLKFDFHHLMNAVTDELPTKYFDTQIAQWMIDENDSLGLKHLGKVRLDAQDDIPSFSDLLMYTKKLRGIARKDLVTIWDIPVEVLGTYAAYDARLTYDLVDLLKKDLGDEGLDKIYYEQEMPFLAMLLRMERAGITVDQEKAAILKDKYDIIIKDVLYKFDKRVADIKSKLGKPTEVNPNSPQQLAELLFEDMGLKSTKKTASGALSTAALVLQRIKRQDKTGIVELLMEYKKYEKVVNTYLVNMLSKTDADGRIRTNFNQTGTVTGRLSSSGNLNLQNIPARGDTGADVRDLFIAKAGHLLIGIDYSQIELRILAHYSRDENLVRAFYWGSDPHQLTADRMGVPRYVGKSVNFGTIYGQGAPTLADQIEKAGKPRPKESQAAQWLRAYDKLYPSIPRWKKMVLIEGRKYGFIETLGGRHRHAEGLDHYDNYIRARAERQLINSKIQGSAGDVINSAMLKVDRDQHNFGATTLLQVHDELTLEVPEEYADEAAVSVQRRMEGEREVFGISVPVIAEPSVGHSWAEVKG